MGVSKPKRTAVDWLLEGVSFAALVATIVIVASNWPRLATRLHPRVRVPGAWDPGLVLWSILAINLGSYALLTAASYYQKIISIPALIDQGSPQIRQLVLSMTIVLKTAMTLLSVYLVWSLVNVMLGHVRGVTGKHLTVLVLLVPLPLLLYTVKLRRHRR